VLISVALIKAKAKQPRRESEIKGNLAARQVEMVSE
jgi:hypothetical protein